MTIPGEGQNLFVRNPKEVLRHWADCFNDGKVDDLAGLYDPASTLLSTFSSDVFSTETGRRGYFTKLLNGGGCRVALDEGSLTVHALGGDCYVLTGLYDLKVKTNGKALSHSARFTVVMDISKRSPILNHHSSVAPNGML